MASLTIQITDDLLHNDLQIDHDVLNLAKHKEVMIFDLFKCRQKDSADIPILAKKMNFRIEGATGSISILKKNIARTSLTLLNIKK